jgi:hypothetical protein
LKKRSLMFPTLKHLFGLVSKSQNSVRKKVLEELSLFQIVTKRVR